MNRLIACLGAALAGLAATAGAASAQNLVVANARIIVGDGRVIEHGSVVVRDGKIVSVGAGAAPAAPGATRIDATGMTVMPGFIDVHRHLIQGEPQKWFAETAATRMRELLESGVTTVQSGGDQTAAIVQLKRQIDSGAIKGPRIVAAGWTTIMASKTEEEVRKAVRDGKAAGLDSIAELIYPAAQNPFAPTEQERKNLAWAMDEANKAGIPLQVHAVSPGAMMESVRAGVKKLIHTPHYGWLTDAQAKETAGAGAQVATCAGFGAPVFGVFNQDNKPTFRDGKPWPEGVLAGEGRGREAGYKPVNARTLFDNGVTLGYCTDTTYNATAALAHELKVLNLVFSPIDLVKIMGPNSAALIDRPDLGTLEAGKLGDLIVLTGNPLEGYWNFVAPVVVARAGVIMIDKRDRLKTVRVLPR